MSKLMRPAWHVFGLVMILLMMLGSISPATARQLADGTSREKAIPVGESGSVGDFDIRVLDVTPDATDQVLAANMFNDTPAEGHQFAMVRVALVYTGADSADPATELNFQAVGVLGRGYTTFDNSCGVYIDKNYDVGEMFEGASAEMNVCWEIDQQDADSLIMYVEPLFTLDSERVWFSLGNDAVGGSPTAQETPVATGRIVEESSRSEPIPMGDIGVIGDYQVSVISVTPDATEEVRAANMFNDAPAPGNQFFMARVNIRYSGTEPTNPAWDLNFKAVGQRGRGYTTFDNSCGVYADKNYDVGEMFEGASAGMNICWQIASDDAESLVMYVEPVFSLKKERVWFSLDETSVTAHGTAEPETTSADETDSSPITIELETVDIKFSESELRIPANTDVELILTNAGMLEHDFVIEDPFITIPRLGSGQSGSVTLNLPAGEYTFYCSIPGHKAAGMTGTLIVE